MKTKTMFAALLFCFAVALAPTIASGDAGSAVQVDLTQLGTDVTAAHDTLVADFSSITAAAQAGDKATVKADISKLRADASTLLPAVRSDRTQLRTDIKAAKAANVTGLGAEVRTALTADRAALKEIRQAAQQAHQAVKALRNADKPAATTTAT